MVFGLFINIAILANLKSFGVPYFAPYSPVTSNKTGTNFLMHPIFKREKRADFLNTKKVSSQEEISLEWRFKNHG